MSVRGDVWSGLELTSALDRDSDVAFRICSATNAGTRRLAALTSKAYCSSILTYPVLSRLEESAYDF